MFKKALILALVLLMLIGPVAFAAMHGMFEGYPIVKVKVDGQKVDGDVPAINFKGRTMVPVRLLARH